MNNFAAATEVGVLGIQSDMRTKRSKRFKNMPRLLSTHELSTYWIFRRATVSLEPRDVLIVLAKDSLQRTTFMRSMCSLLPADEGTMRSDARSLMVAGVRKRVIRSLSVRQTVFMLAGLGGFTDSEAADRFDRIVTMARVNNILNELTEELPHTIWLQIEFSIAMFAPVKVLAFDGTATVGEPKFRKRCLKRLRTARERGQALMIATRDPALVQSLGTKAIILDTEVSLDVTITEAVNYLEDVKKTKRRKRQQGEQQGYEEPEEDTLGF